MDRTQPPRFEIGDPVRDREADDPVRLVVLNPDAGVAESVPVPARDDTVAGLNPAYPPSDRVVTAIHTSWLERHVGARWTTWNRTEIPDLLETFCAEWRLQPQPYDFPESRLSLVESRKTGQATMDAWQ